MEVDLTGEEIQLILRSLDNTKKVFQEYPFYPDENFRKQQIATVDALQEKLKSQKRQSKK